MNKKFQQQIMALAGRSLCLAGRTVGGADLAEAVSNRLNQIASASADPASRKAAVDLYMAAQHDKNKLRELCGLRVEQTNNYILASTNFMRLFFNVVTLQPDERPVVQNNTKQQVTVGYVGAEGGAKSVKLLPQQVETLVDLRYLTSDPVNYRLRDIYAGDISQAAQATVDVGYDLSNQMDKLCYDLLTASVPNGGAFGTFTFTGNKASRVYLANSRINTANLPATNDVVVPGTTGSTKFRYGVFAAIGKYGAQWAGAFSDGDLVPTGTVVVPGGDVYDLADEVTPSGSTNNDVAAQLLKEGPITIDYLGRRWTVIPDNTLASGTCYAQFNKTAGDVFLKPAFDDEFVDTNRENNIESRRQQKVFGAYITSPRRLRVARFQYKS
jgi:hypothetical protein